MSIYDHLIFIAPAIAVGHFLFTIILRLYNLKRLRKGGAECDCSTDLLIFHGSESASNQEAADQRDKPGQYFSHLDKSLELTASISLRGGYVAFGMIVLSTTKK